MSTSDLAGKNVVVTGPTSGIGRGTALALAGDGATVILVARNTAKCKAVAEEIRGAGGPEPIAIIADLSLLSEAKRAAEEILALDLPIDILVNNAGLVNRNRILTPEGLEQTMAVNYFAPFAMTLKLLPALRRAERARIVNVTSNSYVIARLDFDDLTFERRYWMLGPYSVSKLGNIYFSRELARRLEGTEITVNAVHPGLIFTNLGLGNNSAFAKEIIARIWRLFAKDESEGHECVVYAATSPELEGVTGKYIADCKVTKPKPIARRDEAARRLWDVSESTTNVRWERRPGAG
jgi:NAD(P)-dependent dehydrogenase (short-subunit alcohol dehydrogenase family)